MSVASAQQSCLVMFLWQAPPLSDSLIDSASAKQTCLCCNHGHSWVMALSLLGGGGAHALLTNHQFCPSTRDW